MSQDYHQGKTDFRAGQSDLTRGGAYGDGLRAGQKAWEEKMWGQPGKRAQANNSESHPAADLVVVAGLAIALAAGTWLGGYVLSFILFLFGPAVALVAARLIGPIFAPAVREGAQQCGGEVTTVARRSNRTVGRAVAVVLLVEAILGLVVALQGGATIALRASASMMVASWAIAFLLPMLYYVARMGRAIGSSRAILLGVVQVAIVLATATTASRLASAFLLRLY